MLILHAADFHLGLRITRFPAETNRRVREARFTALEKLVDTAHKRQVDAVLIAGDLFDDNHVDDVTRRRALELLEKIARPVFVLPGNHDPLTPDSVWQRPPWNRLEASTVRVLTERAPISLGNHATLWPCPLTGKTSFEDPTSWLPPRALGDPGLRIGLAHGSVKDRPNLPEDDHLIDPDVADAKGFDYLALGHWHAAKLFPDRQGVSRVAYPGTHEPMRFRSSPVGWSPYSNGANADLFADNGRGLALLVDLQPGTPPKIEEIELSQLSWREETHEVRCEDDLSRLIDQLAQRPGQEKQLLRLTLQGVLNARAALRLDELRNDDGGVLTRFFWSDLRTEGLLTEPTVDELSDLVGKAVLRRVYDQLCLEEKDPDEGKKHLAREAMLILYRYAQECQR